MKKLISMLLAASMLLTLAACKQEEDLSQGNRETNGNETTSPTDDATTPTDEGPTDPATTTAPTTSDDNESGPVWEELGEGSVAVFYGKESAEVKTALDAALTNAEITYTDFEGESVTDIQAAVDQGAALLLVSLSDASKAQDIVNVASTAKIPLVFFNCSVPEEVVTSYDRCALLETDEAQIGRTQGRLVGDFVAYNFDSLDLNGDGKISYVLLEDDGSSVEAASCTTYGVEAANEVLSGSGLSNLEFYDSANAGKVIAAPSGGWTKDAGKKTMEDILKTYNESSKNLVELVLVNSDTAALGVVEALQAAGYNTMGKWYVPVFGAGSSDEMVEILQSGAMSGTVMWDATNMANAVCQMTRNLYNGSYVFEGLDAEVDGTWRANVAYGTFTGE